MSNEFIEKDSLRQFSALRFFSDEISAVPDEYRTGANHAGMVERIEYDNGTEMKHADVYLPYGYDAEKQYDILYLMHGGGGNADRFLGSPTSPDELKHVLDHMIEDGLMRPLIVVTPSFYPENNTDVSVSYSWECVKRFPQELVNNLMPAVESAYSTYAKATDEDGLFASRSHRGFSGFSMGSVTTWYVFEEALKYFRWFIPVSGDSWAQGIQAGRTHADATAQALASSVAKQGFAPDDFFIYAITGSEDIAQPQMTPQLAAMRNESDVFHWSDTTLNDGNLTYRMKEGGRHDYGWVSVYLYNALQDIWPAQ